MVVVLGSGSALRHFQSWDGLSFFIIRFDRLPIAVLLDLLNMRENPRAVPLQNLKDLNQLAHFFVEINGCVS